MTARLTRMQERYVWLAGSYPAFVVAQGRGRRSPVMLYNLDHDAAVLTIFGYGNPLHFLKNRGLFRQLQDINRHVLTEAGEEAFATLMASDKGIDLNAGIRHVEIRRRGADGTNP